MYEQVKLKCITCDGIYYLEGRDADRIVPEGAEPGEAFKAPCPHCNAMTHAVLADE